MRLLAIPDSFKAQELISAYQGALGNQSVYAKTEKSVAEMIKYELSGQFGDFEKFRDRVIYVSDKIEDLIACK